MEKTKMMEAAEIIERLKLLDTVISKITNTLTANLDEISRNMSKLYGLSRYLGYIQVEIQLLKSKMETAL